VPGAKVKIRKGRWNRHGGYTAGAYEGRKKVGQIQAVKLPWHGGVLDVAYIKVDQPRGGVGTKLYEQAAQDACEAGLMLSSAGYARNRLSGGFWAKQQRKGRTVRLDEDRIAIDCGSASDLSGAAPTCEVRSPRPMYGERTRSYRLLCDGSTEGMLDTFQAGAHAGQGIRKGDEIIESVIVSPEYRRQGAGTKLYEAAAQGACKRGARLVSRDRLPDAKSHNFWAKQARKGRVETHGKGDDAIHILDCESASDLSGLRVQPKYLLWAGGAALVLGVLGTTRAAKAAIAPALGYRYGWAEVPRLDRRTNTWLNRDPSRLLPSFARKVDLLIQRLRAQGFDPIFWEGYRTPERAADMARIGTGIRDSMHIYGAAVDIIDRNKLWKNPAFFRALGREAKALGLYWGGDFGDSPHVQALPVSAQNGLRRAPVAARNTYVQRYLA
jgi:GNAT superfamily N-acetyltransferase